MSRVTRERPVLTWTLRLFLLLNLVSALAFIIYACILEKPPKTALPLGLLIIGIVSLVVVVIGVIGSFRVACCLNIYMILGAVVTLAELGVTLAMFFNYHNIVSDLNKYARKQNENWSDADKEALKQKVRDGRWFFLAVVILQAISVLVALVLRLCIYPRSRDFENFEEGGEGNSGPTASQIQMQKLQQSIGRNQPAAAGAAYTPGTASYASSKLNKSTTQKMAAKYGDYSSDYQQKGFFARTFGRG